MGAVPDVEPVSIVVAVERTLAELSPPPRAAALVALARMYAANLADAEGSQNSMKEIGPKLTAVLVALGAGKAPAVDAPHVAPAPAVPEAVEAVQAARPAPVDPVADELDALRRRKAGA